jgi:dihydroorotase
MKKLLIRGGRVVDPHSGTDEKLDIFIQNGRVRKIGKKLDAGLKQVKTVNARDQIVAPGFIDLHTHLREPGREDKETILTGTKAACHGGFTSVLCMPNTTPPIDDESVVRFVIRQQERAGFARVYPVGAITKGLAGRELTEIGHLVGAGVVAISDDGNSLMNSGLMRRALEYATMFGIPIISHCEDMSLTAAGVMNEGYYSTLFGMRGAPTAAEQVMVARDIILAEYTRSHIHITHVSCKGSVECIRRAKQRGVMVTSDTAPHYFTLNDSMLRDYNPNLKINPPLRSLEDVEAIKDGLKDGTIDAIATDHAPHTQAEKEVEFDAAPSGIVGLETALGLVLKELVEPGVLGLPDAIKKLTSSPSTIVNLPGGKLQEGSSADITIFDPRPTWVCDPSQFLSKSKNSPFKGWTLSGKVNYVLLGGEVVVEAGEIASSTA